MPRVNGAELEDYLEDRDSRREVRKMKKKMADNSPPEKKPAVAPKQDKE